MERRKEERRSDSDGDSEIVIVIVKVTMSYGRVWPGQALELAHT